jgi:hypothetical protein
MKLTTSKWPIVPPDPRLITIEEMKKRCGLTTEGSLANGSSNRLCRWRRLERGAAQGVIFPGRIWDGVRRVRRLPISSELLAEVLSEILEGIVG